MCFAAETFDHEQQRARQVKAHPSSRKLEVRAVHAPSLDEADFSQPDCLLGDCPERRETIEQVLAQLLMDPGLRSDHVRPLGIDELFEEERAAA